MAGRKSEELCDYVSIKSAKVTNKEDSTEQATSGKIFSVNAY